MKRRIHLSRLLLIGLPIILVISILSIFCFQLFKPQEEQKEDHSQSSISSITLEKFLKTSMEPVGQTMYVWGGGWNKEDTAAGEETKTIGISRQWKTFFEEQDSNYNYENTLYQIHDGLDCSGYVGWVIYNTMETASDHDGYVMLSGEMAQTYASYGWGTYLTKDQVKDYLPGDIMSNEGHVYIVLGSCEDGSILLVHSSPPGVRICGTDNFGTCTSQAITLADQIMREHYPEWYEKYPDCVVDASYLSDYDQFRWNTKTFSDASSLQTCSANQIKDLLFKD